MTVSRHGFRTHGFRSLGSAAAIAAVGTAVIAATALAVHAEPILLAQATPVAPPPAAGATKPGGAAPAATAQKRATTKATEAPPAAAASGDSGLRQRVEALEEQLVDLQVVIGTLESLARSGGTAAAAAPAWRSGGGASASDPARLDGIETQIRALTAQLEQLSAQVRQGGGASAPSAASAGSRRTDVAGFRAPEPAGGAGSFGSTTVTPGAEDDAIGGLINGQGPAATPPSTRQPAAVSPPAAATAPPPAASDAGAKQLYETAYGHLLQQDYGAAEAAFDDFLKRYPSDGLAGNAQYWLGESHYVRGQYKAAATAFLKGYQSYGKSAKAPDSLLKLAMSLERLGQKDAACSSFGELGSKFPNAPAHVRARAQSERQRIGCS